MEETSRKLQIKYILFLIDKAVHLQDLRGWVGKEAVWCSETATQRPEAPCAPSGFLVLLPSTADQRRSLLKFLIFLHFFYPSTYFVHVQRIFLCKFLPNVLFYIHFYMIVSLRACGLLWRTTQGPEPLCLSSQAFMSHAGFTTQWPCVLGHVIELF